MPVNSGQGTDHNQRRITLRKSLVKHNSKWARPGGSQTFALTLRIAVFSFANETVWAVQNAPLFSKSNSQAGSFLLPLSPPQGSGAICGYWQTLLLAFLSPPHLKEMARGGGGGMWKKWPWARDFLGPLSQINLNVDRWTQTLSLWNPNVFLGLIFVSLNPWKKTKTPLVSANKFSFLHYRA